MRTRGAEQKELEAKGIKVGDTVRTAYRGGVREGPVKEITEEPKVVLTRKRRGQADKEVRHNPSTLEKVEPGSSDEKSPELQKAASAKRRGVQKRAQRSGAAPQEQEEQEAGGRSPRSRRSGTAAAQAPTRPKAGGSRTRARGKAAAPKTPAGRSSGRKRKAAEPAPASGRATRASKAGMTTRAAAAKRKKRG